MCIVSNWVNEAQDFIAVKKYDDLPNSLIPSLCQDHHPYSFAPIKVFTAPCQPIFFILTYLRFASFQFVRVEKYL